MAYPESIELSINLALQINMTTKNMALVAKMRGLATGLTYRNKSAMNAFLPASNATDGFLEGAPIKPFFLNFKYLSMTIPHFGHSSVSPVG